MTDLTQNPFGKYNGTEQEYVLRFLNHDSAESEGISWTGKLESDLCHRLGVKYAIACNSGTSGLHAALFAVGVRPGDEVISPGLTVIMDAYATIHLGATPVFADIAPDTLNIDPGDVERKITSRTKAILAVSLYGLPADMDPLMEIGRKHGVPIIEDSAQTVLGMYKGKIAGTMGHMGVFSLECKKHLTSGSEGGIIVTHNEELAVRARKFAGIGYRHLTAEAGRTSLGISRVQDPHYKRFDTVGLNYRMPEICAAIGLAQAERMETLVWKRQECARFFDEAIRGCPWMVPQKVPEGCVHSYFTYGVKYYGDDQIQLPWKDFYNQYKEMGGDGFYGAWQVPYLEPVFEDLEVNGTHYGRGLCPVAEELQPRLMQFKTNYRNLDVAREKASILKRLIYQLSR